MAISSKPSLMNLPSELRLLIYEYLLVPVIDGSFRFVVPRFPFGSRRTQRLCSTPSASSCAWCVGNQEHLACWGEDVDRVPRHKSIDNLIGRAGSQVHTAIMACSRLIYQEARPVLYGNLQLSIFLTGTADVHRMVDSMPEFPCSVGQLHFFLRPETVVPTSIGKENILQTLEKLHGVLDGYKPACLSAHYFGYHPSQHKMYIGMLHEVFLNIRLMPLRCLFSTTSNARQRALRSVTTLDKRAHEQIDASLGKAYERLARNRQYDEKCWLKDTLIMRSSWTKDLEQSQLAVVASADSSDKTS